MSQFITLLSLLGLGMSIWAYHAAIASTHVALGENQPVITGGILTAVLAGALTLGWRSAVPPEPGRWGDPKLLILSALLGTSGLMLITAGLIEPFWLWLLTLLGIPPLVFTGGRTRSWISSLWQPDSAWKAALVGGASAAIGYSYWLFGAPIPLSADADSFGQLGQQIGLSGQFFVSSMLTLLPAYKIGGLGLFVLLAALVGIALLLWLGLSFMMSSGGAL